MRKTISAFLKTLFLMAALGSFWPLVSSPQTMQGLIAHKQESGIWTSVEIILPNESRAYRATTVQKGELYKDGFETKAMYVDFTAENCDIYTLTVASGLYAYQGGSLKLPFESFHGSNLGAVQIDDNEPIGFITTGSFISGDEKVWGKYELARPQIFLAQMVKGEIVSFLHKGVNKIDQYSLLGASQAIKRAYKLCLENK